MVYAFQGGVDGEAPEGIVFDQSGNIVGTTIEGGQNGLGAMFELTPSNETTLYSFANGSGDNQPAAGLVEDAVGDSMAVLSLLFSGYIVPASTLRW